MGANVLPFFVSEPKVLTDVNRFRRGRRGDVFHRNLRS
jgi:hypothetical protein